MSKNKIPALHPGTVLNEEFLKPFKLSQNQIARELSVTPRRINEIVNSKRSITADTALRLARYFGNSSRFWLGLQMDYDLDIAQDKSMVKIRSEVKYTAHPVVV